MSWISEIEQAIAGVDRSIVEELAQHANATYAAARAEGLDAGAASARVREQIAAWARDPAIRVRRPRSTSIPEPPPGEASPLAAIGQDARYAWRLLRRQPSYAAVVIATLALGIAAATVLGSVAYGVLLKPLPWADAPRLVRLYESRQGSTHRFRPMMTNGTFREWAAHGKTLDALGAWSTNRSVLSTGRDTERITTTDITPALLDMLRGVPMLGRPFAPNDGDPGRSPVMLLSYGFWQQQFGGRPDALGQTVRLDGKSYTVIGVMPASFAFPDGETRAWTPLYVEPVTNGAGKGFSVSLLQAIGRLRPGVTPAQAAAEGTTLARAVPVFGVLEMAVFGSNGPAEVSAVPLLESLTADVRPAILILLAAVVLLLLTAVANAASLQLARAAARRRELAIRAALGAGRGRLLRQTLVENLLLGLLGGVAGILLAALMHRALPSILPPGFPRLDDLTFGWRIQLLAIGLSIAAGLGCGILPALHVSRPDLVPALTEDSLAPVGGGLRARTARIRAVIMSAQVAMACVLLVGALLLVRSFVNLLDANVGYDPQNVLVARVVLPDGSYTPAQRLAAAEVLTTRLRATPGVTRAAYANVIPFTTGENLSSFPVKRRDGTTEQVQTGVRAVGAGYFAALGQRVIEGREFTSTDTATSQAVAIVNREFSRKYLDGRAYGWTLPGASKPGAPKDAPSQARPIVGVVDDTARHSVTDAPQPEIYFAATQTPFSYDIVTLVIRAAGDPRSLVPEVRTIAHDAAPGAPVEQVMTMREMLSASLAQPRLYAVLLATFAVFALTIAGVGLFGVLSYTVALRAREIGVRTALGAQMRDIVLMVVSQSLTIALAGIGVGLAAAAWLAGTLRTFLYGVPPRDAASFAAVAIVLLCIALIASVVPARRAAGVDPIRVLRN